jgi:glycosyltransferase involved in cell wall biosynthesis
MPNSSAVQPADSSVGLGFAVEAPQRFGTKVDTAISLVLPMFNESPVVEATLTHALGFLDRLFEDFEIVVADDGSTDDCAEKVARWVARDARLKLVRLPGNQRFGGALRAGLSAASNEFLVYTDFDLPVELNSLPRLLRGFSDADVLTGYSDSVPKDANWRCRIISRGYNSLVRTLFGLSLRDINFGFKAMRKSVWDQLALRSCSPFVDAELFIRAQRQGFRVKEVAVPFSQRQQGASHIRRLDVIAATLWDVARLQWELLSVRKPRGR